MVFTNVHLNWLQDTGLSLTTNEGKTITVLEFLHQPDETILSEWAKHFRNHYCLDNEIDFLRGGTGLDRKNYLVDIKFPSSRNAPGPSIRAGDFGEILSADYLEYILNYWVPRTRYSNKAVRNESTKGSDVLGFKFIHNNGESLEDTLAIFEAKTQFSGREPNPRLQDAVDGSAKDHARRAESLNAIKQRFLDKGIVGEALRIQRFQNIEDHPYKELYGAVAILSSNYYESNLLRATITNNHPNSVDLMLMVIKGEDLMPLVTELYRRAADEA
ncbi:virulence associated protein [Paenibacillus sp. FSL H7-0357]|uniref:Hachiman antiphage defense system protein HamA n=1 Tax=Paenibacillus sp. FSL H7-0357 TaxID=1536774 RepID=UPI0004F59570|nr:Hachiman antiphage defense system protein HamA [Paenibacillus sp. FSL H7-0357]AIQ16602.1 virulence associated protein [Paenibacillus sp. FSL H7-0357]